MHGPRAAACAVAAALALAGTGAGPGAADVYSLGIIDSTIATLDQEILFDESAFGRRVFDALTEASAELSAENRAIEAALAEEERALTEARATLAPEEFRPLAEAFDDRVTALRNRQQARARALGVWRDLEQQRFFEAAVPVLTQLMRDSGALVIVDSRAVLLALEDVDLTARAIARIDARLGDGAAGAVPVFGPATLPPEPPDLVVPRPPAEGNGVPGEAPPNGIGVIEGPPLALPDPAAPPIDSGPADPGPTDSGPADPATAD